MLRRMFLGASLAAGVAGYSPASSPVPVPGTAQHDSSLTAEQCRRSLYRFTKEAWDQVVPEKFEDNWHIGCICEHLQAVSEGEIQKLIINVPPGSAKSTLVSVMWPAWEWIDNPGEQSLFGSYDIDLALRDSVRCRTVFDSEWYRRTFEPTWKMAKDQNAKGFYTNTSNGNRYTFGLGAGGKLGWRGNKVVVDDPNNAMDRYNAEAKANAVKIFNTVLSSRVNDLSKGKFLVIQQRVAHDDFTGVLLEQEGTLADLGLETWEHLMIPAEFKPSRRFFTKIGWTDPRTEEGELFFPKKFPQKHLDLQRYVNLGEEDYAAQYDQSPVPAGGSRFNSDDFVYYDNLGRGLVRLRRRNNVQDLINLNLCYTFVSVDLAASEKKSADYTVFSTWAVSKTFDLILLKVDRKRLTEPKIIEKAIALYSHVGYNGQRHVGFLVEDNGLGLPIAQAMQAAGIPTIFVHIHRTDKLVRSATAAIRMAAGQIFLPSPGSEPWLEEWIKEHVNFPGYSHDDQVDATSLAAEGVFRVGFAGLKPGEAVTNKERQAHEVMENKDVASDSNGKHVPLGKRFFKR